MKRFQYHKIIGPVFLLASCLIHFTQVSFAQKHQKPVPHILQEHLNDVSDVKFSRSDKLLASVDYDGRIIIWDVSTQKVIRKFQFLELRSPHIQLEWDASGQKLLCWSDGAGAIVIDLETMIQTTIFSRSVELEINGGYEGTTSVLKITADGRHLLRGADGIIEPIYRIKPKKKPVYSFLQVIDLKTRKTRPLTAPAPVINAVLLDDGRYVAVDIQAGLLTGDINKGNSTLRVTRKGEENIFSTHLFGAVSVSTDGKQIAIAEAPGKIEIYQRTTLKKLKTLQIDLTKFKDDSKPKAEFLKEIVTEEFLNGIVTTIGFSTTGSEVAAGTMGGVVQVWDNQSMRRTRQLMVGEKGMAHELRFAPGERQILSVLNENSDLLVHSLANEREFNVKSTCSYDWSADGKWLAVGTIDGKILMFETEKW